jgi:ribosomal-protein-serine acetyltransferase
LRGPSRAASIGGTSLEPRNDDRLPRAPDRIDLGSGASLRLLTPEDAERVFDVVDRERERLRPWLSWVDETRGPADTRRFIEETIATRGREHAYGIWAADGLAGTIGLHTDPVHRSAMVGYWIDARHEGHGLVTKASRALTDVAFRDLSMHRVWLTADPRNLRSCAVAERLGFRLEGIRREDTLVDGVFRDTAIYAVLEHEWRGTGGP